MTEAEGGIDLDAVMSEIEADVAARRASGDFPPGLERDLDLIFARFSPAVVHEDDLEAILASAERTAFIDVDVPTASNQPGVAPIKRGLRKAMSWYLRYLAHQVTLFANVVVAALRHLGRRVEALEAVVPGASPGVVEEANRARLPPEPSPLDGAVVDHLRATAGRSLVGECGAGHLVAALGGADVDAYGVDPRVGLFEEGGAALDLWVAEVGDHLAGVDDGALGGLVLAGCVERLALGDQLALADAAARVLAPGGRLAVLSALPAAWTHVRHPAEVDLAPGRPLHPETWAQVLTARGFVDLAQHYGEVVNALVGPGEGLVTATRR